MLNDGILAILVIKLSEFNIIVIMLLSNIVNINDTVDCISIYTLIDSIFFAFFIFPSVIYTKFPFDNTTFIPLDSESPFLTIGLFGSILIIIYNIMSLIDFINNMTPIQRYQYIISLNEETIPTVTHRYNPPYKRKSIKKKIVTFLKNLPF